MREQKKKVQDDLFSGAGGTKSKEGKIPSE